MGPCKLNIPSVSVSKSYVANLLVWLILKTISKNEFQIRRWRKNTLHYTQGSRTLFVRPTMASSGRVKGSFSPVDLPYAYQTMIGILRKNSARRSLTYGTANRKCRQFSRVQRHRCPRACRLAFVSTEWRPSADPDAPIERLCELSESKKVLVSF